MKKGKLSIVIGIVGLLLFMLSGYLLVYMNDFAAGQALKESLGEKGYELTVIAHAHGNLFALMNIIIGILLNKFDVETGACRGIAVLGLLGFLMPLGILGKVFLNLPPIIIFFGEISMIGAFAWLLVKILRN